MGDSCFSHTTTSSFFHWYTAKSNYHAVYLWFDIMVIWYRSTNLHVHCPTHRLQFGGLHVCLTIIRQTSTCCHHVRDIFDGHRQRSRGSTDIVLHLFPFTLVMFHMSHWLLGCGGRSGNLIRSFLLGSEGYVSRGDVFVLVLTGSGRF